MFWQPANEYQKCRIGTWNFIRINEVSLYLVWDPIQEERPVANETINCPFRIIVDDREKKPFAFSNILSDAKYRRKRINVDLLTRQIDSMACHSIDGMEERVAVRRMSPEELLEIVDATMKADALAELLDVGLIKAHLPTADYTIDGYAGRILVERKGFNDLFGTLSQHRDRFERELRRMAKLEFAAVVIEGEWSQILRNPPDRSKLNPKTVIRSVIAWQVRFPRVHWWCLPGREVTEAVTFRLLERFWMEEQEKLAAARAGVKA